MKYTVRKGLKIVAFMLLFAPSIEAMGLFSWLKNGYSNLKTSLSNASTGTKMLVGIGALATVGVAAHYAYAKYWNTQNNLDLQKPISTVTENSSDSNAGAGSNNLNPNPPAALRMINIFIQRNTHSFSYLTARPTSLTVAESLRLPRLLLDDECLAHKGREVQIHQELQEFLEGNEQEITFHILKKTNLKEAYR